jgi:uncharacterized membrane protein
MAALERRRRNVVDMVWTRRGPSRQRRNNVTDIICEFAARTPRSAAKWLTTGPARDSLLSTRRRDGLHPSMALGAHASTESEEFRMQSRARLLGHSLHQILIAFPLGLLGMSVAFDVLRLVTGDRMWSMVSFYMIGAGVLCGLAAAGAGLIDYLAIPPLTRARYIGRMHGLLSVLLVVLFACSWLIRRSDSSAVVISALALSLLGGGLLAIAGWLGGELVTRMGVGVDDGAHLDAQSSLSGNPIVTRAPGPRPGPSPLHSRP